MGLIFTNYVISEWLLGLKLSRSLRLFFTLFISPQPFHLLSACTSEQLHSNNLRLMMKAKFYLNGTWNKPMWAIWCKVWSKYGRLCCLVRLERRNPIGGFIQKTFFFFLIFFGGGASGRDWQNIEFAPHGSPFVPRNFLRYKQYNQVFCFDNRLWWIMVLLGRSRRLRNCKRLVTWVAICLKYQPSEER